jgi:hypothetical protein
MHDAVAEDALTAQSLGDQTDLSSFCASSVRCHHGSENAVCRLRNGRLVRADRIFK